MAWKKRRTMAYFCAVRAMISDFWWKHLHLVLIASLVSCWYSRQVDERCALHQQSCLCLKKTLTWKWCWIQTCSLIRLANMQPWQLQLCWFPSRTDTHILLIINETIIDPYVYSSSVKTGLSKLFLDSLKMSYTAVCSASYPGIYHY